MSDKKFVKGLYISDWKKPDWVKLSFSLKVEDFKEFISENVNDKGYVNIDVCESREGKLYAALNEYKSEKKEEPRPPVIDEPDNQDELPF